jgi:hypothetical protein
MKEHWRPLAALAATLLFTVFLLPICSSTFTQSAPIAYTTQQVQDTAAELGNIVVKQTGADGVNTTTYKEPKSLYNLIFGGGVKNKITVKASTVSKEPITEVVSSGTKKYQYMYCTNGSYRSYTDAQFKDANTGFTHKSTDYCAANNEGANMQLADVPPTPKVSYTAPSAASSYAGAASMLPPPNCTTTSIPYGIEYKDVSWLQIGQTQTYPGMNGTFFSCLGTTVQPLSETIYRGTGQSYSSGSSQSISPDAAKQLGIQKCAQQYSSAKAQIEAAGAGFSSAMDELNRLNSQCLSAAQ